MRVSSESEGYKAISNFDSHLVGIAPLVTNGHRSQEFWPGPRWLPKLERGDTEVASIVESDVAPDPLGMQSYNSAILGRILFGN